MGGGGHQDTPHPHGTILLIQWKEVEMPRFILRMSARTDETAGSVDESHVKIQLSQLFLYIVLHFSHQVY